MDASKQPQQNPQVYTTVGSIYNPSAAPLQPPIRRGRPVKWPPHNDLSTTKSSLSGLPFTSLARSPSNTATTGNLLHYSPLQQNSERAVSPITTASDSFAKMSFTGSLSTHDAVGSQEARELDDDEDDADEVAETLKSMSVKTLTNLASYPNPQQKDAQKVLSRARPTANSLATLRGARSDPVSLSSLLQSDGANEYPTRPITRPMFDTILSKGPGAPQPLTAGPPGPRRFKSSANEQTSSQPFTAHQQPQAQLGSAPSSQFADQRHSRPWNSGKTTPLPQNAGSISIKAVLKESERRKITDTLTAEEAAKYYPKALPSDFDYLTKGLASNWHGDYPLDRFGQPKKGPMAPSPEDLEARSAKINELWYAGSDMMNKSIAQARRDKSRRDLERTIGIQSGPSQNGRTVYPKLMVEEANRIPASEHAVPLISMAYQTFLDHPNFTDNSKLPKLTPLPTYKW
ncbi:hypothetical protein PG990_011192 [Apiospora arundinis]